MLRVHRHSWIALSCCFFAAMGILLLFGGSIAPADTTIVTTTTITEVSRGSALPSSPAAEPPPAVEAAKTAYVGNIKSKKFHRLSCRYADCTNCKAKFATREEAIEAGFDPCGICDP